MTEAPNKDVEIKWLKAELLKYGNHVWHCISVRSPNSAGADGACDCGWGQLKAELEGVDSIDAF